MRARARTHTHTRTHTRTQVKRQERVCCLLVLNSVTSTPQWIRQPKAAWFADIYSNERERELKLAKAKERARVKAQAQTLKSPLYGAFDDDAFYLFFQKQK